MQKFIPMLLQQKFEKERVQGWLDKTLKEYGALEGMQTRGAERTQMTEMIRAILSSMREGVKGQDYPGAELLRRMGGMELPGVEVPAVPGDYQEKLQGMGDLMKQLALAKETGEFPTEATIGDATGLLGSKAVMSFLEKLFGGELRKGELAAAEETTKLEWDKLGVRRAELKEKGKEEKPGKAGMLEKLIKEREKLRDKVEVEEGDESDYDRLERLTKQISGLQKEMGLKSDGEYKEAARRLKAKGYTSKNIDKYPEVISIIKREGFEIWVLKGYL